MKNKWMLLLALLGCYCLLLSEKVSATDFSVDDQAHLFTAEQITQLNQKIQMTNPKAKTQILIVTNNNNQENSQIFADMYMLNKIGADKNGVTFYIDINQRQFHISTSGNMIDYLNDARIDAMLDHIEEEMVQAKYYQAATTFLADVDHFIEQGVPSGHYRIDVETGNITYYKTITPLEGVIAFILSAFISAGFFFFIYSRYQLKQKAFEYPFRQLGVLTLTQKNDQLVNQFVTTRRIPQNNSKGGFGGGGSTTHTTGGGTFGGGGRSF